jgi:hypothetical protein
MNTKVMLKLQTRDENEEKSDSREMKESKNSNTKLRSVMIIFNYDSYEKEKRFVKRQKKSEDEKSIVIDRR